MTAYRRDQKIPKQIKKYLSVGANKKELIEFLFNVWSTDIRHIKSLSNRCIYFSRNDAGYKLYVHQEVVVCQTMDQLRSNQEEAETKVFLAANIAVDVGCTDAVIVTVDSDIGILACYAIKLEIHLMVRIGNGSQIRIIDVGNN